MPVTCEELCRSFSVAKLCNAIAKSDVATYLVIAISMLSAIICFVVSITQLKSADGMVDACTKNDIIATFTPFAISGTDSNGTECIGYCSWSSNNTGLRLSSLSLFIILIIAMIFSMKKMKYIWLIRVLLFIILVLLFTSFVEDFSSLVAGKRICDNDFEMTVQSQTIQLLYVQCDNEIIDIESCSLEPYVYMLFADIFTVIMCYALWQLIAYYKEFHQDEHNEGNENAINIDLFNAPIPTIPNQTEDGRNISIERQQQTTDKVSPMNAYEEY